MYRGPAKLVWTKGTPVQAEHDGQWLPAHMASFDENYEMVTIRFDGSNIPDMEVPVGSSKVRAPNAVPVPTQQPYAEVTYNANGAAAATSAAAEGWHAGAAGASGADSNVYNNLQLQYVQGPSGPELVLPLMGQSAASQDNGGAYGTQAPYYNTMSSRRGRGRGSRGGFGSGGLGAGAAVGGRNVRGRGWRAAKQQQAAIRKPLTRPPVASYSSSPYGSPYLPSAAAMAIGAAGSPQQYNYHGQPASPALSVSQPMDSMQVDHNLQLDTLHRQQSLIDSPVYKAIAQIVMTSPKLAEVRRVLQDGNSGSGGVLLAPAPSSKPKPTKRKNVNIDTPPEELVGHRLVKLFRGRGHFGGMVAHVDPHKHTALISYDDGDEETMTLTEARMLVMREQTRQRRERDRRHNAGEKHDQSGRSTAQDMYSETQNLDYSYDDAGEAAGDELDTPGEPHTEPGSEADVSLAATDYTKGTTRGRAADEVTKLRTALKQAEQRARDAEVEVITLRARLETVRSALRLAMSASEAAAAALANSGVSDMMLTPLPKATGASHPGSVPGGSGSPLATSAVSARPAGFGAGLAPAAAAAAAAALAAASGTSDAIAADPLVVDGEADSKTDGDNDDAEEGEDESPQPVAGEIAAVVNTPQAMEEDGDEAGLA